MKFVDFICFDAVIPSLKSETKDGAIEEMVTALVETGNLAKNKKKGIIQSIIKREKEASTGIGKGLAVPHVKSTVVKKIIAVVSKSEKGIDFQSLDKELVYSMILLVSPADQSEQHIVVMEKIFKYLQQETFRKFLGQAKNAEEIKDLFTEADEREVF